MSHYPQKTSNAAFSSNDPNCPVKAFIAKHFGWAERLTTAIGHCTNHYDEACAQLSLENQAHVRNVYDLMDWMRISELNHLLGFESIVKRCPNRVVKVLSSFDRVLRWSEQHAPENPVDKLRSLYRLLEARVWEINPLVMLRAS